MGYYHDTAFLHQCQEIVLAVIQNNIACFRRFSVEKAIVKNQLQPLIWSDPVSDVS